MSIADLERPDVTSEKSDHDFSPETDAAKTPEQLQQMIAYSVQREQAAARLRLQKKTSAAL
jgi:hypothetical protein